MKEDTLTIRVLKFSSLRVIFKSSLIVEKTSLSEVTLPRPSQFWHFLSKAEGRAVPTFLRVISTRPRWVMPKIWLFIRSFLSSLVSLSSKNSFFSLSCMSIKSIIIMPPMFRRRICLTISLMALRFVSLMVSSKQSFLPIYLPVLTSMEVRASVSSKTR